ncbi:MAG: hypothetical protein ACRETM_13965 [Stenotrophobium sp.]
MRPKKMSWDQMDELFTQNPSGGRVRMMHRIARHGHAPPKILRDGVVVSLVDVVDQTKGFEGTATIYKSRFWELSCPPGVHNDHIPTFAAQVLKERGLYQADPVTALVGSYFEPENPAFKSGARQPLVDFVNACIKDPSVDQLSILSSQFRLALDYMAFNEAQIFKDGIRNCMFALMRNIGSDDELRLAFSFLVETRILRGEWRPFMPRKERQSPFDVPVREPLNASSERSFQFGQKTTAHTLPVDVEMALLYNQKLAEYDETLLPIVARSTIEESENAYPERAKIVALMSGNQ